MQMQRRPMEVRDILQTGFRLLTDHWMPLLLVNAVAAIPGLMITVATSVPDGQLPDGGMLMFGMLSAILGTCLNFGRGRGQYPLKPPSIMVGLSKRTLSQVRLLHSSGWVSIRFRQL